MFRIAVCDDEPTMVGNMERMLAEFQEKYNLDLSVSVFLSGEELCKTLETGEAYHLLYLDVCMKLLDGIEVSRKIREEYLDESLQIVYVSSSQAHTMQMFENRPMNFLPKPVAEGDVERTLLKAMSLWERNRSEFEFQIGKNQYRVKINEIVYFESDNKKILIHTIMNTIEFYGKLSQVEKQLAGNHFVWIHKSYLVNYAYIREARYDEVIMSTGLHLPITQTFRKGVRDFMVQRRKGELHV
jgi:DNA-binding LytR/AlgR family response regulator